jgi:hypothetical protein
MPTITQAAAPAPAADGAERAAGAAVATFVTAAELKRPLARPYTLGRTGTLRLEDDTIAFEGSDGRRRIETSLANVRDLVCHRSGYGFWARFDGTRYFVIPRHKPRPYRLGDLFRLRIFVAVRMVSWDIGERRRSRELVRTWVTLLTGSAATSAARAGAGEAPAMRTRGLRVRIARLVWLAGALLVAGGSLAVSLYLAML